MASTQLSADYNDAVMSLLDEETITTLCDDAENHLYNEEHNIDIGALIDKEIIMDNLGIHRPPGQKEFIFQLLLEQAMKIKQKERDRHALRVLVDVFCYEQGYEVSYGPRSEWITENKKRLAEVIGMEEDKVEAFFERYPMVDCGNCESCIEVRAREREARLTKVSNFAEMPS